jgi:hypothetical protein
MPGDFLSYMYSRSLRLRTRRFVVSCRHRSQRIGRMATNIQIVTKMKALIRLVPEITEHLFQRGHLWGTLNAKN